jgi:hypothetical protein
VCREQNQKGDGMNPQRINLSDIKPMKYMQFVDGRNVPSLVVTCAAFAKMKRRIRELEKQPL